MDSRLGGISEAWKLAGNAGFGHESSLFIHGKTRMGESGVLMLLEMIAFVYWRYFFKSGSNSSTIPTRRSADSWLW